jgi:hypothetical protein
MPDILDVFSRLSQLSSMSPPQGLPFQGGGAGNSPPFPQMDPYAYSGMPPFSQPPPPPEWHDLPEEPSPAFVKKAEEYLGSYLRESRAYAVSKQPEWQLYSDLRKGVRSIWSLGENGSHRDMSQSRKSRDSDDIEDEHRGLTDFVFPISAIETSVATTILNQIFSGANPVVVEAIETIADQATNTDGFTIAQKLTKLFWRKLCEGKLQKNVLDSLVCLVNQGHTFAKVYWSTRYKTVEQVDINSGQKRTVQVETRSCPVIAPIKLDRMLLDWEADVSDVDLHRGIGHWTERTYDEIMETFAEGGYTLNREEVKSRWEHGSSSRSSTTEMDADPDKESLNDKYTTVLWVWEWHGEIPFKGQLLESCVTFVTDPDADGPASGVIVRCSKRPALECGIRPMKGCQFIPNIGQQLGLPLVAASRDLLYQLSSAVCQFSDGVRHQIQGALAVQEGGQLHEHLQKHKRILPQSWVASSDPAHEAAAIPSGNFQPGPQLQLIQEYRDMLQRNTVTDTFVGMGGGRKTASEASMLQQQSAQPTSTYAMLFVQGFLQPLLDLALKLLQDNMNDDETITVKDRQGQSQTLTVSSDEVRNGKFRVVVTLTEQDAMNTAKAQGIERMLPVLQQTEPLLAREGITVRYGELIQMWINLINVDGSDRVLHQLSPEELQAQQQAQQEQMMMEQGGQQGQGPPQSPDGSLPMAENGGPMGAVPTDQNVLAQMMQQLGAQAGPGAETTY